MQHKKPSVDTVLELIPKIDNINLKNKKGETAYFLALDRGLFEIC